MTKEPSQQHWMQTFHQFIKKNKKHRKAYRLLSPGEAITNQCWWLAVGPYHRESNLFRVLFCCFSFFCFPCFFFFLANSGFLMLKFGRETEAFSSAVKSPPISHEKQISLYRSKGEMAESSIIISKLREHSITLCKPKDKAVFNIHWVYWHT